MWDMTVPWWELAIRAGVIYAAVYILLRMTGNRPVSEWTPFDLVLLVLVSGGVSKAMRGDDESLPGAVVIALTMVALNWTLGSVSTRFRVLERVTEGRARLLVRDGKVDYAALRELSVSRTELLAALRKGGCFTPKQAEYAVLETTGEISVRKRDGD